MKGFCFEYRYNSAEWRSFSPGPYRQKFHSEVALCSSIKSILSRLWFHCTLMITVTIEIIHTTRGKKVKDINERHAWLLLNFTVDIKNE